MAETFAARVSRGAKLLDQQRPGWEKDIVLEELDLKHCLNCILGQLYGSYDEGLDRLLGGDDTMGFRYSYGFSVRSNPDRTWRKLTRAWGQRILARLKGGQNG